MNFKLLRQQLIDCGSTLTTEEQRALRLAYDQALVIVQVADFKRELNEPYDSGVYSSAIDFIVEFEYNEALMFPTLTV